MLVNAPVIPKEELEKRFQVDFSKPTVILIQHPVTTESAEAGTQILATLAALKELQVQTIAILPNNDAGFSQIVASVQSSGLRWYPSLDVETFANLYRHVWAIVGNSSSGLHEAATFHVPTVNIGTRQQGRERPASVIDVGHNKDEIVAALKKALFDEAHRSYVRSVPNPYGDGTTAPKVYEILRSVSLEGIIQKKFHE